MDVKSVQITLVLGVLDTYKLRVFSEFFVLDTIISLPLRQSIAATFLNLKIDLVSAHGDNWP